MVVFNGGWTVLAVLAFLLAPQCCTASVCSSGQYLASGYCKICPDGQYQEAYEHSSATCKKCPPGSYTSSRFGNYAYIKMQCIACKPGTYQPKSRQTGCLACPGRTYQKSSGQARCLACPAGNALSSDKSACTPCSPGTALPLNMVSSNDCYYCNNLSYQNLAGQVACRSCPSGTAIMAWGGTAASACKRYRAGTVSFLEVLTLSYNFWTYTGSLRRTVTSGKDTPCSRQLTSTVGVKMKSTCQSFSAFILPTGDALLVYTTAAESPGTQTKCIVRKGQSKLTCKIFDDGGQIGKVDWYATETVQISGLRITLTSSKAARAAAAAVPGGGGNRAGRKARGGIAGLAVGAAGASATPAATTTAGPFVGTATTTGSQGVERDDALSQAASLSMGMESFLKEAHQQPASIRRTVLSTHWPAYLFLPPLPATARSARSAMVGFNGGWTVLAVVAFLLAPQCCTASTCNIGQYLASGYCETCPDGQYQDAYGHSSATCKTCPPGSFSSGDSVYLKASCTSCPMGSYQADSGAGDCWICPDGTAQPNVGQTSCTPCGPGSYTSSFDGDSVYLKAQCLACGPGSYQPESQQTGCLACPEGTYQGGSGQTDCLACAAGNMLSYDKSACTPCPPGTMQPLDMVSSNDCFYCDILSYQDLAGQVACSSCPSGTAVMEMGGTAASACKQYLAGTVSFLEVLTQQFSGQTYTGASLRRTVASGTNYSCLQQLTSTLGLDQDSSCESVSAFILPTGDTVIVYLNINGFQSTCVVPKGQSDLTCLITTTGSVGDANWVGVETMQISNFQITLTGGRAARAGTAAVPGGGGNRAGRKATGLIAGPAFGAAGASTAVSSPSTHT
ncbi:signal peptide protein [Chlorella vulgaris]